MAFTAAEWITLGLGGGMAAIAGFAGYRAWLASRITPEERERQRRAALVASGKMGDATITEFRDDFLFYAYMVRGVEYTASQDITLLKDRVPGDLSVLSAVSVRYNPKNPANSIVVSEDWTGLHVSDARRRV
jgi:hypothetical protein